MRYLCSNVMVNEESLELWPAFTLYSLAVSSSKALLQVYPRASDVAVHEACCELAATLMNGRFKFSEKSSKTKV